jgi:ribonucleoside-triphosphate reductase
LKVIKRDGRIVDFNRDKIKNAVLAAFKEVDGEVTQEAKNKASEIASYVNAFEDQFISVEKIQDFIEEKLMLSRRKDVAKVFIIYRNDRTRVRDRNSSIRVKARNKLNSQDDDKQNANVDGKSFGGRVGAVNSEVMKEIALDEYMSKMARENHLNNEIYIHDLDSYAAGMHNCLSVPFDKLLENGFNTRQTDVRPAQSVSTAFQLVAVIFQLQSLQQFGGVSATHLDWTMVPYVRKSFKKHLKDGFEYIEQGDDMILSLLNTDEEIRFNYPGLKENYSKVYQYAIDMTEKEVYQAVEGMYHNLNTLQSRSGNQLPFTSVNYGTCTEPEGRMVIKALLEVSIKGIGKLHKTSIFPCGIFQCMKGVNRKPGDPNYDLFRLALKSTAQRLYPNYANVDWSGNEGYDPNDPRTIFSTMGCRTANGYDINGFGQLKDGRGNICPVTIILPTLAMEAKQNLMSQYVLTGEDAKEVFAVEYLMVLLDEKIHEAKDMLLERFEWICSQSPDSAKFMYENGLMEGYIPEEGIISALKHGTLGIGQIGLAETLQILIGCDHTTDKGMELAKRIEKLFSDRCKEFKEEYKLNFGVYYTPAENLCYTSMKKFKEKYGVIKDVSDKEFFTNSIHVPVWVKITPMEKIDIEAQLTGYSSAGCITYIELDGSVKNNIDALETIVNYAMDKDIPYFAINVPNDMCTNCGYTDDIADECPMCGCKDIRRLRRVTGYLTGDYKSAFNKGKQQEVEMRIKHQTFE